MSLLSPNTDFESDFYEKGKFILAWRLVILFSSAFLVLTITIFNSNITEFLVYLTCSLISISALLYLHFTKRFKPVYHFLTISGVVIAFFTINFLPEFIHIGDFIWIILVIIFAFFGLGARFGFLYLTINLITVIYYSIFNVNSNIENIISLDTPSKIGLTIELSIGIICVAYVIHQFVIINNKSYSTLLETNEKLLKSNEIIKAQNLEKTTLVQEVHHRVKNNLQIIISLLRLQKNELKSEEAKEHFADAINRIMVMSLIHQKLYNEKTLATIDLISYLTDLTEDIKSISPLNSAISITIESDLKQLGLKTIVPFGLIVNELVSNSLEHAFEPGTQGAIKLKIKKESNTSLKFTYQDSGIWNNSQEIDSNFGLELINTLTNQLDGEVNRISSENGTVYTFTLKNINDL